MALNAPHIGSRDLSGIALAATAFAFSTSADTIFKLLSTAHPAYQLLAVNGLFALLPIFICAYMSGGASQLATTRPLLHLIRACAGVMSSLAAIYAYERLPLTDFYAIVFAGPLLVTVLSAFWLGEKVDAARWCAIGAGFSGILVVANPFQHGAGEAGAEAMIGRISAFASVFCYALSVIMVRRMRIGESSLTFSFFGYMVAIAGGMLLWLMRDTPSFNAGEVVQLAVSGTLGGIGSVCLMEAYHRAPVALVAPFQYTQIFWGAVASYFVWHLLPDQSLVIGATIVAASGMFVLYRDMRGKNRAT
jgi:drug/metabolite transporter (DMT)-like permease